MARKQFKTEVADLLQLIIHSLYSNKEIFLREIISNASDAIDKLKYLSLTDGTLKGYSFDPKIQISFTEDGERTLTVSDNGIGMNEEDLNNNLGTIASSGTKKFLASLSDDAKKDSNLIGQFGVGFYSAFMVAKKIEVVSKKAGEDQAFKWTSDGQTSYSIEPSERAEQGTTITMYLNSEDTLYASRWQLETLIKKYSDHIAYPIYLEYDQTHYEEEKDAEGNPKKTVEHKNEKINSSSALWRRSKSELKEEEYKEFYKNTYSDYEDPLFYLHTKAEGTTEYTTLFYIPATAPVDMNYADYKPGVKLYVKRVYITDDDKTLLPPYLRFVRGVIDSEDLPLNVSREILQENKIMAAIRNGSVKKLLSEFKKMAENNPELFQKFIKEYNRPLKEGLYSDYMNRDALLDIVRYKSSEKEGYVSLKEYKANMKEGQKSIYYLAGGNEKVLKASPLLDAYKKKGYEVLILDDDIDDFVIGTVPEYDSVPLKAINRSDALDDIQTEEEKARNEEKKGVAEKVAKALGDKVKNVVVSSRLGEASASVIVDENDPSVQMQRMMKMMGNKEMEEVKPILEINPESKFVKRIEEETDEEMTKTLASVLLGQALLQEGLMPGDPAEFAKNLSKVI
ncbi:MAG: molecular chaperone HtpG [Spirochaetales bacterium]|nr:molecular chaperone HtpG [Candidatus Physcosoma equi]